MLMTVHFVVVLFYLATGALRTVAGLPMEGSNSLIDGVMSEDHFAPKTGDPQSWAASSSRTCGGARQSPIDIDPWKAKNGNFPKFVFGNYGRHLTGWKITNNEHTGIYSLPNVTKDQLPYIQDGGLPDRYNFAQFHFHWAGPVADSEALGSEHTIKSRQFHAELHLVHYNAKYGSIAEAISYPDGLAVLGVFIQLGRGRDRPTFPTLYDLAHGITEERDESPLNGAIALKDLLPLRTWSFFRYSGSLTTPACEEIVSWTVFDDPLVVSPETLRGLRRILGSTGDEENFRPVLPVGDRDVFYRSASGLVCCHLPSGWPFSPTPLSDLTWWTRCLLGL